MPFLTDSLTLEEQSSNPSTDGQMAHVNDDSVRVNVGGEVRRVDTPLGAPGAILFCISGTDFSAVYPVADANGTLVLDNNGELVVTAV